MDKEQLIEEMARADCIGQYQVLYAWSDQQMEYFMYQDPKGMAVMDQLRQAARAELEGAPT